MTKRRAIDPDERALWQAAMRGVARHRANATDEAPPLPSSLAPAKAGTDGEMERGSTVGSGLRRNGEKRGGEGIDRRQALRLKRGQLPIEARLDLHGMTQTEAHRALEAFIARGRAAGKRVLLIVTGKGTRDGSGVLRAAVPRWLAEPALRPLVLKSVPAIPRDGGDGALYLLLRRPR